MNCLCRSSKSREAICEYQRQSEICCQNGENQKNLEIWEKAYSEFPNDCRVIEGLMHAINRDAVYPCPKAEAERIIALGEELLQRSTDTRQREMLYNVCAIPTIISIKKKHYIMPI